MENLLILLATLFSLFLVLAAAVEALVDVLRGAFELRFPQIRTKISLDEALQIAAPFIPTGTDDAAKLQALKSRIAVVELTAAQFGAPKPGDATMARDDGAQENIDATALRFQANAIAVQQSFDRDRERRIFILRALSVGIGCSLVALGDLHVLRMVADHSASKLNELAAWVDVIVGGLAAAAGSSYWHDQLDRVRKIKEIAGQMKQPQV